MQNHELERILTKIFKERMASTLQWNGDQFSVEIEDSSRVRKARRIAGKVDPDRHHPFGNRRRWVGHHLPEE